MVIGDEDVSGMRDMDVQEESRDSGNEGNEKVVAKREKEWLFLNNNVILTSELCLPENSPQDNQWLMKEQWSTQGQQCPH